MSVFSIFKKNKAEAQMPDPTKPGDGAIVDSATTQEESVSLHDVFEEAFGRLESERNAARASLDEAKAKLAALEAECADLKAKNEQASANAQGTIGELQAQLDDAKKLLAERDSQLQAATEETTVLKADKAAIEVQLSETTAALDAANSRAESAEKQLHEFRQKLMTRIAGKSS